MQTKYIVILKIKGKKDEKARAFIFIHYSYVTLYCRVPYCNYCSVTLNWSDVASCCHDVTSHCLRSDIIQMSLRVVKHRGVLRTKKSSILKMLLRIVKYRFALNSFVSHCWVLLSAEIQFSTFDNAKKSVTMHSNMATLRYDTRQCEVTFE